HLREHLFVDAECHGTTVTWTRVGSIETDATNCESAQRFATEVVAPIAVAVMVVHCAASTFGDGQRLDEALLTGRDPDNLRRTSPMWVPAAMSVTTCMRPC